MWFSCFRPLIRGFFFYANSIDPETGEVSDGVSVPSFGDSFFIRLSLKAKHNSLACSFRPLIRGFFFYAAYGR